MVTVGGKLGLCANLGYGFLPAVHVEVGGSEDGQVGLEVFSGVLIREVLTMRAMFGGVMRVVEQIA